MVLYPAEHQCATASRDYGLAEHAIVLAYLHPGFYFERVNSRGAWRSSGQSLCESSSLSLMRETCSSFSMISSQANTWWLRGS